VTSSLSSPAGSIAVNDSTAATARPTTASINSVGITSS
jgi:hypothetical protein